MNYICNIKKSPIDHRDYIFIGNNNNKEKLPEELDYTSDLQPIRNQGKQGSCYAQCVACVKEWQENRDYGFNEYFSPQFFYNCRPNLYDKNTKNDEGMYSRDVMKLMKEIGICYEKYYAYGRIEHKSKIPEKIVNQARQHLISGYAKVNTMLDLKRNLIENGPCMITFPVYNYSSEFWKKKNWKKIIGGHAVVVVGYNNIGFKIRNSWGKNWGDKGYSIYKYLDWGSHWEIWTTIDEKTNVDKLEKLDVDDKKKIVCCNMI